MRAISLLVTVWYGELLLHDPVCPDSEQSLGGHDRGTVRAEFSYRDVHGVLAGAPRGISMSVA